jgi:hypothetical protein
LETCVAGATDPSGDIREQALLCLEAHGARARAAVPAIIANLSHESKDVRRTAVSVVPVFGSAANDAVHALRKLVVDSDSLVRSMAMTALASIGEAAAPATPELLKLGFAAEQRDEVAELIIRIGAGALPAVADALESADGDFKQYLLRLHRGLTRVSEGVNFDVRTLDGETKTISVSGNTVVVMLATWCPYSREFRDRLIEEQSIPLRTRKHVFLFTEDRASAEGP